MMELISNIFPKISMMLGALVIVCPLCGSALAAVRWTFYKWERLIRMHDGIMILFEMCIRDRRINSLSCTRYSVNDSGPRYTPNPAADGCSETFNGVMFGKSIVLFSSLSVSFSAGAR